MGRKQRREEQDGRERDVHDGGGGSIYFLPISLTPIAHLIHSLIPGGRSSILQVRKQKFRKVMG